MKLNVRIIFAAFSVVLFAYALFEAKDYSLGAQVFPLVVSIPGLILSVLQFIREVRRGGVASATTGAGGAVDIAVDESIPARTAYLGALRHFLGWMCGLVLVSWIFGFKLGIIAYFIVFLRVEGHAGWLRTLLLTAITVYLIFIHLGKLLEIYWPPYLLEPWLGKIPGL